MMEARRTEIIGHAFGGHDVARLCRRARRVDRTVGAGRLRRVFRPGGDTSRDLPGDRADLPFQVANAGLARVLADRPPQRRFLESHRVG